MICFFVSDLHGSRGRYRKLMDAVRRDAPAAVFIGGDLLPSAFSSEGGPGDGDFVEGFLADELAALRDDMAAFPRVFAILGNDDAAAAEPAVEEVARRGLWDYVNERVVALGSYLVAGYSFVPPTPFMLKDWERYDVSRYVDPGCVSPEEGFRSVPVEPSAARYSTIAADLEGLFAGVDTERTICLFHTPPYGGMLDRAALDGKAVDHVPLDVHVGSIALERFIESRRPLVTLHGHVHESARITGSWRERRGRTWCMSAAHDGPELALVVFDPERPDEASRRLL